MAGFGVQPKKSTQDGDVPVIGPPSDSVSSLAFNGNQNTASNALLATSWDSTVTCYQVQTQASGYGGGGTVSASPAGSIKHDGPALCCDFASDNMTALSGGCDGTLRQWNIAQGPQSMTAVGRHDNAIRCLKFATNHNCVVTGSWDKSIRLWDLRSPAPVMNLPLTERVYAMDCKGDYVVVGTADKNISVIDLRSRQKIVPEYKSPLNYQTRCISIFNDIGGFALGCIEGRVAIEYFSEVGQRNRTPKPPNQQSFVFKCHRDKSDIYAVNSIHFHNMNTFVTAGSDGVLSTWDKDNRSRLANFDLHLKKVPVTDVKFSPNGTLMAYSLGYDWSKGADQATLQQVQGKNAIMIHVLQSAEISKKK